VELADSAHDALDGDAGCGEVLGDCTPGGGVGFTGKYLGSFAGWGTEEL